MATFEELAYRVKMIVDTTGFRMPVYITKILHESENDFIRKTFCTMTQIDIQNEASSVKFDGIVTNITFVKGSGSTRDTIIDSEKGFVTDGFAAGQRITIKGSTSNDGEYTIYSVSSDGGTITLTSIGQLASESGVSGLTIKADQIPHLIALPSNFVKEFRLEYRGIPLEPLNLGADIEITKSTGLIQTGTPYFYWIEGDYIQIVPKPLQTGLLKLWYCYYQTDDTTASPIIPTSEHYKLINHTIAILYEMDQKPNEADRYYAKFERDCRETRLIYAKRRHSQRRIADVIGGEGKRSGLENWINIIEEG